MHGRIYRQSKPVAPSICVGQTGPSMETTHVRSVDTKHCVGLCIVDCLQVVVVVDLIKELITEECK